MKPSKDAYGQEIFAYLRGEDSFEIIERDDGYFDSSSGAKVYFSDHDDWPEHEKKAMEFVRGRVLEIGCVAGRHSLYLQKRGFEVLGIDNSPLAAKVCKLRGMRKVKVMPVAKVNFKPNSFDTIIMLGNNFGLFASPRKGRFLLRKFHKMTSDNAMIIAESNDPCKTENPAHLEYHELNRKRGRMPGQLRIRIRFGKFAGDWFDYLMVSKPEMEGILEGTGWRVREFLDSGKSSYIAIIEKASPKTPVR